MELIFSRHVQTVSGGLGANSEPPIDRIFDMIEGDHGAIRIDQVSQRVTHKATSTLLHLKFFSCHASIFNAP
jgi:hypothetical protein